MIILGIDPGSIITGYGVLFVDNNSCNYVASGCIRLSGDFATRLSQLYAALSQIIE